TSVILGSVLVLAVGFAWLRREAQLGRRLARLTERLESILDAAGEGIYGLDLDGRIAFANPAAARMLGYEAGELAGRSIRGILLSDDVYLRKDGSYLPVESVSTSLRERGGDVTGAVVIFRDVSERRAQMAALERQATHDALTGLPNRALLQDRLGVAIAAARRSRRPLALLLMDLDRFKEINDTLGHATGDTVLRQVGPRVRRAIRESDTVARLGGDEFAVLLPDVGDATSALSVARGILSRVAEPILLEGQVLQPGASIGIALYPDHGDDADALLKRADVAMYLAKRAGAGVAVYAAELDPNSRRRLALTSALRGAIEAGELFLEFQPKLDIRSGRVRGAEALVRWRHPQLGVVAPAQFIPLAEQTGLIGPLTTWVLREALRTARGWRAAGLDLSVAVNLSPRTLQDPSFPAEVARTLAALAVPASALTLELTETGLMTDPERALSIARALAAAGVRLSVDDFGTGYSSLASLAKLPARELKIDRAFVAALERASGEAVIVRSTIELGHSLALEVVAEGVETAATLEAVAA
ncbi:MAG TPA: EAL domain-containing protein, partial [Planctomycetota bacterium]|nr:EAL domain-containing protein [Planctomycetota bacterium]